ncbi:hypothetical protein Tco_0642021 [Tanacetum coccineum]
MPNVTLPQGISSGGRPRRQETMGDRPAQTRFESLSKQSYDSPLRGVNTPRKASQEAGKEKEVKNSRDEFIQDCDFDEEFDANMDEAFEQVYDANKDTVEEGEVQVPTADMEVNTASASVTTAGVSVITAEPGRVEECKTQDKREKRRKHFAAKRAEERRNRPPTKAQQRSIMCTYLKNMAGWKPKDLKTKSFANVQELFDKAMKRVNTFVDMDTELVGEK